VRKTLLPAGHRAHRHTRLRGFTLIEVLIALAVVTLISLAVLGALGPWLNLKQTVDTERKLQSLKHSFEMYYRAQAFALEATDKAELGPFVNASVTAGQCDSQENAFASVQEFFSEGAHASATDGYKNPFCFFVSQRLERPTDGNRLFYRVLAVVSAGADGVVDEGTAFNAATGVLVLAGDDRAMLVNGYDLQHSLYRETMARMTRLVNTYEIYFTSRYLAAPDRDITRYYFATHANAAFDKQPSGAVVTVAATSGNWGTAATTLGVLGLSPDTFRSAWEQNNDIQVGTYSESVAGVTVKSPVTTGTGVLPYTALLRARLPGPADNWAVRVAVGGY